MGLSLEHRERRSPDTSVRPHARPPPPPPGPNPNSFAAVITGGGCATLTDIYNAEGSSDLLFVLDKSDSVVARGTPTGRWLLAADVRIHGGSTLHVHGLSVNGDCDVLRIKSDGSSSYYEVRGHGGNLSFKGTKVSFSPVRCHKLCFFLYACVE